MDKQQIKEATKRILHIARKSTASRGDTQWTRDSLYERTEPKNWNSTKTEKQNYE